MPGYGHGLGLVRLPGAEAAPKLQEPRLGPPPRKKVGGAQTPRRRAPALRRPWGSSTQSGDDSHR